MILGLIRFDSLFSEGSAHLKNFSIVETSLCSDFSLVFLFDKLNTICLI